MTPKLTALTTYDFRGARCVFAYNNRLSSRAPLVFS